MRRQIYVTHAQYVAEKFLKTMRGTDKIQYALERLDRLTKDEGLSAVAQTLGIVHGISKVVIGGARCFRAFSRLFVYCNIYFIRWKDTDGSYWREFGYVSRAKQA